MTPRIFVFAGREYAPRAAAVIAAVVTDRLAQSSRVSLVLAGGATPAPVYRELAVLLPSRRHWERLDLLFGDERAVDPGSPHSNFRMAVEALGPVASAARVHRIQGELGAGRAAEAYERVLGDVLGEAGAADVVLLGVGSDGHTASLFPGAPALAASGRVAPARAPEPPHERVTLTLRALDAAANVLFLVRGDGKAEVVRQVLAERADLPAARVRCVEGPTWILDRAAASRLAAGGEGESVGGDRIPPREH